MLYNLVEIFESLFYDLSNGGTSIGGLSLDAGYSSRDQIHLIANHLLSLIKSCIRVDGSILGESICALKRYQTTLSIFFTLS
jgi:hypothetical protein